MILVDTSVLVDYLEGRDSRAVRRFDEVLERDIPFGISPLTYMEVLQGAATEKDFDLLNEYLGSQTLYAPKAGPGSYAAAAKIFYRLRKVGLSGPGSVDCLIAQTAIEYGLFLLHNDSDFDRIAKVTPLKMW
jgi:predicted nucleic acid-binding protein